MHAKIYLNTTVVNDLSWLASIIPWSIGVWFVNVSFWENKSADFILWTDASTKYAISFVYAGNSFVYQLNPTTGAEKVDIFFLELLAILSAIHHIVYFNHPHHCILLWIDSLNSVAVINKLSADETMHKSVLMALAGLILQSRIDLRVWHIEGKKNIRANYLFQLLFDDYHEQFPSDQVCTFSPPRDLLLAWWNKSF